MKTMRIVILSVLLAIVGMNIVPAQAFTDIAVHGSMWVAELPTHFKLFKHWGKGTEMTLKAARAPGDEWVHVAIPYATYLDSKAQKISLVQFCAQSNNGAASRPVRFDIWGGLNRFVADPIAWPADNNVHCITKNFDPPVWKEDVGVSVLVHFENNTDIVTLYKAWIKLVE